MPDIQNRAEVAKLNNAIRLPMLPHNNTKAVLTADHILAYAYQKCQAGAIYKCYLSEVEKECLAFRHPQEVGLGGFIVFLKGRHGGHIKVASGFNDHPGPDPAHYNFYRRYRG